MQQNILRINLEKYGAFTHTHPVLNSCTHTPTSEASVVHLSGEQRCRAPLVVCCVAANPEVDGLPLLACSSGDTDADMDG